MYDSPENYILYKQLSLVMIYSEAEKIYYITVVIYEILLNRLNRSKDIYVNPLLEQHFVLPLFLFCQPFVMVLLFLKEPLPAASDFTHALFHGQMIQLAVRQHLLRELLITVPEATGAIETVGW